MRIVIPFNAWSKKRIKENKRATSRYKKYGNVGDVFNINGVDYELFEVKRMMLSEVASYYYVMEGCTSEEEFKQIWKDIHPYRGFCGNDLVWVHFFREARE